MRLLSFLFLLLALLSITVPRVALQTSNIKIREINPVVNEGGKIGLTAVDTDGQVLTGVTFESGSPDIALVDNATGMVTGIKRGFATITARKGNESVSAFVAVARVESNKGAKVPGDTKSDTGGRIYISDPNSHVILRKGSISAPATVYAGQRGNKGKENGPLEMALFSGPTAVTVDNSASGGLYITDTLNHSIRKIDFTNQVKLMLGTGSPGINIDDEKQYVNPGDIAFSSPRGISIDNGNLIVADTDNHAIFTVDLTKKVVRLLAGAPGNPGNADGRRRTALFKRPIGIALSSDGRTIAVADSGNGRVRLITRDGDVSTLGKASTFNRRLTKENLELDQTADGFSFDEPESLSFDGAGNLYVVDKSSVRVVTSALGSKPQIVSLAQFGTFLQPESVVVSGTEVVVLDTNSPTEDESVKVVTVGAPEIANLNSDSDRLEGGAEIVITGKNFAPESLVILGDSPVENLRVISATEIRFNVPSQSAPGTRTLSVQTRGGVAQRAFNVIPKSLSELNDGEITTVAGGIPFLGDGGSSVKAVLNVPAGVTIDAAGNLYIVDFNNHRIRRVDTSGVITTVAGNGRKGFSGDGGPAIQASLDNPTRIALDREGNLFIVDKENLRVRRVDAKTGIITTVAGDGSNGFTGDGGPAIMAGMGPSDLAIDTEGNLFIADLAHNRIRFVDARTAIITTVAGSGPDFEGGFSGDGGPAVRARLNGPFGIALDMQDNLFIADGLNNRIRRVDARTAIITTVVGDGFKGEFGGGRFKGDGGPAVEASLSIPASLTVDAAGNLFIADIFNLRVRRVDAGSGIISTVAGNGIFDFGGDGGPAINANLINPEDVAVDGSGNLFIADSGNDRIRRVDAVTRFISTVAGIGANTFRGDGDIATRAGLSIPRNVAFDPAGNLFIVDQGNNRIRRVDATTNIITTVAGGGGSFIGDGEPATSATLSNPLGIVLDQDGNLFISDRDRNRIRRVDAATGIITTAAGSDSTGLSGDGGPATRAGLDTPVGLVIDRSGNLFIADSGNHRIRRVDRGTGIITTVVGTGPPGGFETGGFSGDGGPAVDARLNIPSEVAFDPAGNLFVLDILNFRVRRVDARNGIITTVAGGGDDFGEGVPAVTAQFGFFSSGGIAVDGAGNLFISDQGNHRIRRVDARTGIITTVIGKGTAGFSGDGGAAIDASLAFPDGLSVDKAGNLYFADTQNNVIRVVKGIATGQAGQPQISITSASFIKPNLVINGSGFGASGASVNVNGRDISSRIVAQSPTSITLKGNKKKLNLRNGANQITVTAGGVISEIFVLELGK